MEVPPLAAGMDGRDVDPGPGRVRAPFVPGVAFAVLGLLLSAFFVRETHGHARLEGRGQATEPTGKNVALRSKVPRLPVRVPRLLQR